MSEITSSYTRTFLALAVSDEARRALGRLRTSLAQALPSVRFADLAGVHLTLAFLGSLDVGQLALATEAAQAVAKGNAPMQLALGRLGIFGPPHAPRVLWVGVGGAMDHLLALQRRLADELAARGFPRESRPFAAHLTLARLSRPLSPDEQIRLQETLVRPMAHDASWQITTLDVMASELRPTGARYTLLRACPLGAGKEK
ncbi:MAG TPA: RNA 2',3'-cyclic phosphodiesterase [Ktedonobacterales bacterium]|nr:RNA 2',3'-cyclic phosphodiesterase [Ktedonobacterales bacterium]